MSNQDRYPVLKSRAQALRGALFLAAVFCTLSMGEAIATPAANQVGAVQLTPQVAKLLEDADKALSGGNVNLALIQLKNAVRLAPANGEVHARLGVLLQRTGEAVAAEHALREARDKDAPEATIVPALLAAMVQRKEYKELLTEFPDPRPGTQNPIAADILKYRAIALQFSGQPKESRVAIDRSVALRRDIAGLVSGADLMRQQGDLKSAQSLVDEAIKLAPNNETALLLNVLLAGRSGDQKKTLAAADEFVSRAPQSVMAKVVRVEALLEANDEAKAKLDIDALVKQSPKLYGRYYRGLMMASAKDFKGAWQQMQGLPPEFVQSDPRTALIVSGIAAGSGNLESGGAILTTLATRYPGVKEIRVQLAAIRLSQNAPRAAIDVLAPLKGSNDPTVHALLAQAYLALKQFNDAIGSLEIANAAPGANELLKRQLAVSELQVGDTEAAIKDLRELTRRDPKNPQMAGPLVAALVRASKWDEALTVVDTVGKDSPKSPFPAFNRGEILIAKGDLAAAQAAFDNALTVDPKFQPALYFRANVLIARGNVEAAKKDLEQLIGQNPTNMPAHINLAQIALNDGQEQEGLAWLDRAIKAAPKDVTPRLALANYQVAKRRYNEAQAAINGLLQVSKDNPDALALHAQIQLLQGAPADAIKSFRALAATANVSPVAYELLAKAMYVTKDQAGAEAAAKRGVELAPTSIDMHATLIDIQIGAGKQADALATARAYASANPGPVGDLLFANTFLRLNRTTEAEAVLDKSFTSKPDARVALSLSKVAFSSGNTKKGGAVLSSWVSKNPNDFVMRREYAAYQMTTGNLAGARKDYEALLKQHPEDAIVLNNLGWLVQKDDPARALAMLTLANKIAPRSAEIADSLGWLKYQRKDTQGALPLLQQAHDIDANNAPISYHFALSLDAAGKRAKAKSLLQATLEKNPTFDGSDDARRVLTRW